MIGIVTIPHDDSPMEQAIREVERCTNVSRDHWEHTVRHPYAIAALKRAKHLAGICDKTQLLKLACRDRRATA